MSVIIDNPNKLNPSQTKALNLLVREIAPESRQSVGTSGFDVEFTFEVRNFTPRGFWVSVRKDIPALAEGNFLRTLERMDSWYVHVGPRGKVEAHIAPKSYHQFKGKDYCGIHIKKDCS